MVETARVDRWLYELLSGDQELQSLVGDRVYGYLAPPGAQFPFVVFTHQGGHDVLGVGPARVMAHLLYQVKAVGKGNSFAPLQPIADRVDALLQGASGSVVDGYVLICVREHPFAFVEVDNGVEYRHIGGLWRILISGG
jgi:hypothetical protein